MRLRTLALSFALALPLYAGVVCVPPVQVTIPKSGLVRLEARFQCGAPQASAGDSVKVLAVKTALEGTVDSVIAGTGVTTIFISIYSSEVVSGTGTLTFSREPKPIDVTFAVEPAVQQQQQQPQTQTTAPTPSDAATTTVASGPESTTSATPASNTELDDVIALANEDDEVIAYTASGSVLHPQNGIWSAKQPRPSAGRSVFRSGAPMRWDSGARDLLVFADGTLLIPGMSITATWPIPPVNAAIFAPPSVWAAGDDGMILRLINGEWRKLPSGTTENLRAIAFDDQQHGIIAGANGFLATTDDGGATWHQRSTHTKVTINAVAFGLSPTHTKVPINAVAFGRNKEVYAAGDGGTVLKSRDGGATWSHVTAEWNASGATQPGVPWPAPWYVLFNALITLPLLGIAARALPSDGTIEQSESVAEMLGSDRPLQKGDPDAMNLRSIALAISRFLRNASTIPPLTIAVTGEWGSGKSSLMNLLKADLMEFGFRPVWFNAWHHQKEEHLLASLLQAVRKQAVPRWWQFPEALLFRVNLIRLRGWKHVWTVLLLVLFLAVAAGHEWGHHDGNLAAPLETAFSEISTKPWETLARELPAGLQHEAVFIASIAAVLGAAWRGLKAFRVDPGALLASVAGSAKLNELTAQISFRDKFAAEFNDVTKALGDRSMLIFIDDLDRCSPESVGEILEAVNFLVSSGDCFVVMGMDRQRVERYINVSFKDVASGEADFAQKYLDKLVNIEVPVPPPTDEASSKILADERETRAGDHSLWGNVRALTAQSMQFWPIALVAVVAVVGFLAARQVETPQNVTPAGMTIPAPTTAAMASTPTTTSATTASPPPVPTRTPQPAEITKGQPSTHIWIYWPAVLFLIPLVVVGGWLLNRPPDLVIHDSAKFKEAVRLWRPVIADKHRTPRALKRFMNRLRYLAMRQRPQNEEPTLWRRARGWFTGTPPEPPEPAGEQIPEEALVALAAMEAYGGDDPFAAQRAAHERKFGHDVRIWREVYARVTTGVRAN